MMLHRHFEEQKKENLTKRFGNSPREEYVSEVFPPEEEQAEQPKRGRKKKTETE